jgi:hypothetical protein
VSPLLAIALALAIIKPISGQPDGVLYSSGQTVTPAFEGWEENPDGTFNMVFGYFNRNLEEAIDVPIGANNSIEPGGPDQGQPTHFLPRRNRFWFRIKVPKDFGKKELVWTLTSRGRTEKAYATLKPEYVIDRLLIMKETGGVGNNRETIKYIGNKAPVLKVEGDAQRSIEVGKPLDLVAVVSDDGIPPPKPTALHLTGLSRVAWGLRVAWFVERGAGTVTFEPEQFKVYPDYLDGSPWTPGWAAPPVPPDGKFPVRVTFSTPGTFVLRAMAHDGGLMTTQDVTVTVKEPSRVSSR